MVAFSHPSRPDERGLVIALHCSGTDAREWRSLGEALGPDFDLLVPEHYGCERTGHWPGERAFTLADEAERTLALIDGDPRPAHLVGHSYGGAVALKVALLRPERVASLSLYEPSSFHLLRSAGVRGAEAFAEIQAVARHTAGLLAAGDHRGAAAAFVDYWSGHGAWSGLRPAVQQALNRWAPKASLDFSALFNEPTPLAAYARLAMPTLLLYGERALKPSRVVVETLGEAMARAWLEEIAGAGHMGPITHADIVSTTIAERIARLNGHRRLGTAAAA